MTLQGRAATGPVLAREALKPPAARRAFPKCTGSGVGKDPNTPALTVG
jgi:hypothetical protein